MVELATKEERRTRLIHVRLTPTEFEMVQQIARIEGRSESNVVQRSIIEAAQRRGLEMLAEPQPEAAPA